MGDMFLTDIFYKVIEYLTFRDVVNLCKTNRQIHIKSCERENTIWKYMLQKDFPRRSKGKNSRDIIKVNISV